MPDNTKTCPKCGATWKKRVANPVQCPRCKGILDTFLKNFHHDVSASAQCPRCKTIQKEAPHA